MLAIQLHGRALESVFELRGSNENAMTYALGWCVARVSGFVEAIADELGVEAPGENATVRLQEHMRGKGITDIEVHDPGKLHWILEAKAGFDPPGHDQLAKYAEQLRAKADDEGATRMLIVLAQSDRRNLSLRLRVPQAIEGVEVKVLSWSQVKNCVQNAYPHSNNTGKALLREFQCDESPDHGCDQLQQCIRRLRQWHNLRGCSIIFIDVVEKFRKYFHPVGQGSPTSPPNYIAFRWYGQLQSVHHIDDFEIITNFASHFPGTTDEEIGPHFLHHLGPAIIPNRTVKTGNLFRAARIYAHIDLLLTCDTIAEAGVKTRARLNQGSKL